MKKGFRIALATATLAAGLALAAPAAQAQVQFRGSFPLPHGRLSIGFGDPYFRVGSYVPPYYRVYSHPRYGYGFGYRSRWIPVRPYRSRWVVVRRPVYFDGYGYGRRFAPAYYSGAYGHYRHAYDPYWGR